MRTFLVTLFLAGLVNAQPADGSLTQSVISTGTGTVKDNRSTNCTNFTFSYVSTGFSALSIQLESAVGSTTPTSWGAYSGSTVTGSNPSTVTTAASATFSGYVPWWRVNLVSTIGTGTLIYSVKCYVTTAKAGATGPTGPSGPTGPAGMSGLTRNGYYLNDGTTNYVGAFVIPATLPLVGNFSWVNQGGATETANNGALTMSNPGTSGVNFRSRITPIGVTSNATMVFACTLALAQHNDCGVGFYESATGKLQTLGIVIGTTVGDLQSNCVSTSSGGTVTNKLETAFSVSVSPVWVKLNISASLNFFISNDGVNFSQVFSSPLTTCFTVKPDNYMYYIDSNATSTGSNFNTLLSFVSN